MKTLKKLSAAGTAIMTFEGVPEIHHHRNAVYFPKRYNFDESQGIYSETGFLITSASLYWLSPPERKGHRDWVDLMKERPSLDVERAIYMGHVDLNFGHTLTEFMPRLWALSAIREPGDKLLVHSFHSEGALFSTRWFIELLSIFEITPSDICIFREPTRIRHLVVASPAFLENSYVYSVFNQYAQNCGKSTIDSKASSIPEMIYISREKNSDPGRRYENEEQLCGNLVTKGFRIVYPEQLSLRDQIALFRPGNIVVGTLGSAFHTSIFGNGAVLICISRDIPSNNFALFDHYGKNLVYYYQLEVVSDISETKKSTTFCILNPDETAADIMCLCSEILEASIVSSHTRISRREQF